MSTVTSIAAAIASVLDALAWVDKASASEYLPSAANASVCAFVVPYNQETTVVPDSLGGASITLRHVLTVEFWIQHRGGQAAATMQAARDAGTLAIAALIDADGAGYTLERDLAFSERVDPAPVEHLNMPWLVATLRVPVENEVST